MSSRDGNSYLSRCLLPLQAVDDQTIVRNRLEAEAILTILRHVHQGEWELISSEALTLELKRIANEEKRAQVSGLLTLQNYFVRVTDAEEARMSEVHMLGFTPMDALHVACAEAAGSDILLTTDDRLRKAADKCASKLKIRVSNPLSWIQERFHRDNDRDDIE